ncbi:MAPK regulated corepressor interacting protein 2 [Trichomycterus rosablanca]|uniref:MAPK regulated corepressor interacting protein 2 n=1 Tax=Trichomycterus rosablanca TaxID=2290929 RepID=UPI002F3501E1
MYTITRGPSKLVTQRRTGPTQQAVESKSTDPKHRRTHWLDPSSPAPKIVFQRLNAKRLLRSTSPKEENAAEGFTPAHEENVHFVYEAWQEVEQKLGDGEQPENAKRPVQYAERNPSPGMKNFVPIDLEEWWAQRFLATVVNPS